MRTRVWIRFIFLYLFAQNLAAQSCDNAAGACDSLGVVQALEWGMPSDLMPDRLFLQDTLSVHLEPADQSMLVAARGRPDEHYRQKFKEVLGIYMNKGFQLESSGPSSHVLVSPDTEETIILSHHSGQEVEISIVYWRPLPKPDMAFISYEHE